MLLMCSATEKNLPELGGNSFLLKLGGNVFHNLLDYNYFMIFAFFANIKKRHRQGCWTWHIVLVNYNIKSYDFPSRLGSCGIAVFQGWSAEFCGICTLKYAVQLACFCLHIMCLDNTLNMGP